jgi:hypothetical protein
VVQSGRVLAQSAGHARQERDSALIPVLWAGGLGNWDAAFPRYILDSAETCDHIEGLDLATQLPQPSAVICIPGRHMRDEYPKINRAAANFDKVIFLIFGDEEHLFIPETLGHKNQRIWCFMPPYPPTSTCIDRVAVNGWPTGCREMIAEQREIVAGVRDLNWSFLGQVTHARRTQCAEAARKLKMGEFFGTEGFTQGKPRAEYYRYLCRSKIVLCPSGPVTPDSFRVAEALEANCIPIVDELTPNPTYPPGYFNYAFGGVVKLPFPTIQDDWSLLPQIVEHVLSDYVQYFFKCARFWANYKMGLVETMRKDLRR